MTGLSSSKEADLERLVLRWAEAVRDRDLEFLEDLLASEFTLTTGRPGAEIRPRDEYLAITRDRYAVESFEFEWIEARDYGGAGLVRSRYRQRGAMDGADRTQTFLMTDVLAAGPNGWRAVARHVSPLPPE